MPNTFVATSPVRFGDIDHAGIMYYPRLFDRMHRFFEDFWPTALGKSYHGVLEGDGIGFPLGDVKATFNRPFRFGDEMQVELTVLRLGTRSVTWKLLLSVVGDAKPRAIVRMVTPVIAMETFRATPLPDGYRAALREYLDPEGEDVAPQEPVRGEISGTQPG